MHIHLHPCCLQDEQTSAVQGNVFQQYLELCEEFGPEDDNK
jgi:hypothetical protein